MTISSMTGYAVTTRETDAGTLTVELKSVNSRFLDLQFRINDEFRTFEPLLREAIMARVSRGKVECRLSFGRKVSAGAVQNVSTELLESLSKMQQEVLQRFPNAPLLSVNELLRWPGVLADAEASQEALQTEVQTLIAESLNAFIETRAPPARRPPPSDTG